LHPPNPEDVFVYVLAETIAYRGCVFEATSRTLGTHFIRPLSGKSLLVVEPVDLPTELSKFEAYRAHVPLGEEQGFYGQYLVDDDWANEIPDIFQYFRHSSFYCSEAARNVIEAVDPGIHQFIPLTLTTQKLAKRLSKSFYGVVPNRYLFLRSEKDAVYPQVREDFRVSPLMNMLLQRVMMNPAARELVEGWPLWAHAFEASRPIFSKKLFRAFLDAGLTGLTETPVGDKSCGEHPVGHVFT